MIKTAGVVFDLYDDAGAFLRAKLAGAAPPAVLSEAALLSQSERQALPDNAFAAVITNGEDRLRKFACTDAGNTAASILYFLDSGAQLPVRAREKVACNLMDAARYHGIAVPDALQKVAGRVLLKADGAEIVVSRKGMSKESDVTGTVLMPNTRPKSPAEKKKTNVDSAKIASTPVISDPYVDVTTDTLEKRAGVRLSEDDFLIVTEEGCSYPLVSYAGVKEAAEHLGAELRRYHPRVRKELCSRLVKRAEALGMPLDSRIEKYGSDGYASPQELGIAVETRRRLWRDTHESSVSMLDEMMAKRAEVPPGTFAEALNQLDIATKSDRHWDKDLWDPWLSTFGREKVAAWRWVNGNDVLSESELQEYATSGRDFIGSHFGEELAKGLAENPVSVFESLPLPTKTAIARQAHQLGDGSHAARINN